MVYPEGIEPPTHSLEGCCSIQLSYGQRSRETVVGAKGFEPSTLWSQTRCATRLRYAPTGAIVIGHRPAFEGKVEFLNLIVEDLIHNVGYNVLGKHEIQCKNDNAT